MNYAQIHFLQILSTFLLSLKFQTLFTNSVHSSPLNLADSSTLAPLLPILPSIPFLLDNLTAPDDLLQSGR